MLRPPAARNVNGSTEKATRAVREESRRGERRNGAKTNSFWSKLKFYCCDTSYEGRGRGPDSRRIISGPVERCTCVAPQVPAVGVAERMSRKLHPWASRFQAGGGETTGYKVVCQVCCLCLKTDKRCIDQKRSKGFIMYLGYSVSACLVCLYTCVWMHVYKFVFKFVLRQEDTSYPSRDFTWGSIP